jgi:hypothetical protein
MGKKLQLEKNLSKTIIYVFFKSLTHTIDVQTLQTLNLFTGAEHFCLSRSAPDSQSGTGSADPLDSGANPHPDPKHCFKAVFFILFPFIPME